MLINGKAFDGSRFYFETQKRLAMCAGNTSCFTTFRTERFPHEDIYKFLQLMNNLSICCFIGLTFVHHTAGIFKDYEVAMLFVALTENQLLKTVSKIRLNAIVQHQ
jgi:hypothetical protein